MVKKIITTVILSTVINSYQGQAIIDKSYNDYKAWESSFIQEINEQNDITLADEFKRQVFPQ